MKYIFKEQKKNEKQMMKYLRKQYKKEAENLMD